MHVYWPDPDDPKALAHAVACMARGVMVQKGAVGAWDRPDAEILGPYWNREPYSTSGPDYINYGYDMLMAASFGPGLPKTEAMLRLGEIRHSRTCRPYLKDYTFPEC